MAVGWFFTGLWAGCTTPDGPPPPAPLQGVVAAVRTVNGAPVSTAEIRAGSGSPATPDAASTAFFFDVAPGRAPIAAAAPGYAFTMGVPHVLPAGLAATSLRLLPIAREEPCDGSAGVALAFEDATVTIAAGDLVDDAGAPIGACTARMARPTDAGRAAVPGDQIQLANDDQLVPVEFMEALFVEIVGPDGEAASLAPDAYAEVTVALAAGHPLLAANSPKGGVFSRSKAYWSGTGTPVIDRAAGTAAIATRALGWLAIGEELPSHPCVSGEVRAGGAALAGVEIVRARPGLAGLDRVTTDERGAFCLPGDSAGSWSALGYADDLSTMWTASGTDLSSGARVTLEAWEDADGDHAFAGPGGDCDDDDPAVSPDPVRGDASFCGDGW